jgi:hypothetical protein
MVFIILAMETFVYQNIWYYVHDPTIVGAKIVEFLSFRGCKVLQEKLKRAAMSRVL